MRPKGLPRRSRREAWERRRSFFERERRRGPSVVGQGPCGPLRRAADAEPAWVAANGAPIGRRRPRPRGPRQPRRRGLPFRPGARSHRALLAGTGHRPVARRALRPPLRIRSGKRRNRRKPAGPDARGRGPHGQIAGADDRRRAAGGIFRRYSGPSDREGDPETHRGARSRGASRHAPRRLARDFGRRRSQGGARHWALGREVRALRLVGRKPEAAAFCGGRSARATGSRDQSGQRHWRPRPYRRFARAARH